MMLVVTGAWFQTAAEPPALGIVIPQSLLARADAVVE